MKIYDESGNEITNPDITKGSVTVHTKVIGSHRKLSQNFGYTAISQRRRYSDDC